MKSRYKKSGDVIIDEAAGLMWQQSGSLKTLTLEKAEEYIEKLNSKEFAGYTDWRLPTLEEAISLMDSEKNKDDDLCINSVFDRVQRHIWVDKIVGKNERRRWVVYFDNGYCDYYYGLIDFNSFVRAVRSIPKVKYTNLITYKNSLIYYNNCTCSKSEESGNPVNVSLNKHGINDLRCSICNVKIDYYIVKVY